MGQHGGGNGNPAVGGCGEGGGGGCGWKKGKKAAIFSWELGRLP